MSRAIEDWDVEVSFASNGKEALDAIDNGKANLLLLDLNMPVMDGYQVLEKIRESDLPTIVIIVSGDIQNSDNKRVTELGAIAFIAKPVNLERLNSIIRDFGFSDQIPMKRENLSAEASSDFDICPTQEERFQETANIAMGKTANRLSSLLDTNINPSIPRVSLIDHETLFTTINTNSEENSFSTISQGFVGSRISGEAILMVEKSGLPHISKTLGFSEEIDQDLEKDLLIYLSGLLASSFLKAYFQQMGVKHVNQGIPAFIDFKGQLNHLLEDKAQEKVLTIEVNYSIPSYNIYCNLVLVFTLDSIEPMNQRSELFSWTL